MTRRSRLERMWAWVWHLQYCQLAHLWFCQLWALVETAYLSYPDPFTQVETKCARLRISQTIRPRKMTLILDLDETLVHSRELPDYHFDWEVHVPPSSHPACTFFVSVRPHTALFLRAVSRWYEVVVFTASLQHYADPVIDRIDPAGCVSRRLFRPACREEKGNFIKDLSTVRDDLSQVVIVDNSPAAYTYNADNAVPISTWYNDREDDALLGLLPLLSGLVLLNDVRSILSLRNNPPGQPQPITKPKPSSPSLLPPVGGEGSRRGKP
mmetsp:Transcript_15980/g.32825  ORF Transcript_15980/g.32825 Transcript_15980/m.32825 type:complete len:268 (+) Transcript_15980:211-1014(+)